MPGTNLAFSEPDQKAHRVRSGNVMMVKKESTEEINIIVLRINIIIMVFKNMIKLSCYTNVFQTFK